MLHDVKEKIRLKTVIAAIPTVLFLAFVYCMMVNSYTGKVKSTVNKTRVSAEGFFVLSKSFEKVLSENFCGRYSFINLNGLVTRSLGIHSLNDIYRMKNNHLYFCRGAQDVSRYAKKVIELSDFLSDKDIDFVYMLIPRKEQFSSAEFAPGYANDAWKNNYEMVSRLSKANVNAIAIDAWFKNNRLTMDDVYFKTDHHWRPNAALEAARASMIFLKERDMALYDEKLFEDSSWKVRTLKKWFLGSSGKRTGQYYGGTDDFDIYFPNFKTDYSFAGLRKGTSNWRYSDGLLNLSYMNKKDYFKYDTYCTYLYGDNPIQVIKNSLAVNEKKLLIVGDSFSRAWTYFMASQFKEIHRVDLRHFSDNTLLQYVEQIKPDIVIIIMSAAAHLFDKSYKFGIAEHLSALKLTDKKADSIVLGDFSVPVANGKYNRVKVFDKLKRGQTYTLYVDTTAYSGGKDRFVQMSVRNQNANRCILNRYFDANSGKRQKWIFTVPKTKDDLVICLFAGTSGHTEGCSASVSNVRIYEGVIED